MRSLAENEKSIALGMHGNSMAIILMHERGIIRSHRNTGDRNTAADSDICSAKPSIPPDRFARVIIHP